MSTSKLPYAAGPSYPSWSPPSQKPVPLVEALCSVFRKKWSIAKDGAKSAKRAQKCITYLQSIGQETSAVSPVAIDKMIAHFLDKGISRSTINRYLSALSVLLHEANRLALGAFPPPSIEKLKEPDPRDVTVTPEMEAALIRALPEDWAPVAILLVETGLRLSELFAANWSTAADLGEVQVVTSKSGRGRSVPLTERALGAVCRLWLEVDTGTLSGKRSFQDAFRRAATACSFSGVTPHTLRHTCATRLAAKGVPIPTIAKWLGHRSIETTMRYVHPDQDALRAARDQMNDPPFTHN